MRIGTCERCGTYRVWVNYVSCINRVHGRSQNFAGQACGDCFEAMNVLRKDPPPKAATEAGADPSIENAVRALEGD